MPELPEVETTVDLLKQKVLKKTFVSIWSEKEDKSLEKLIGKRIIDIERVGKNIFFHLSEGTFLLVHLRMTGHFLWGCWDYVFCESKKKMEWKSEEKIMQDKKNGYIKFIFLFNNNKQLALSDPRKFARVEVVDFKRKKTIEDKLGPDPLKIKKDDFLNLLKGKKKAVKSFLMDQHVIAGIGNIYASEILFEAKVKPQKRVDRLTKKEKEEIYRHMKVILKKSIKLKGDSTSDYRLLDGKKGGYQNFHLVYNRKNKNCFKCRALIERTVVGGRGSYYCPKCQK